MSRRTKRLKHMSGFVAIVFSAIPLTLVCAQQNSAQFSGWGNIVEYNRASVVLLRSQEAGKDDSYGSGVVISGAGHVLTANHVLPDLRKLQAGSARIQGLLGGQNPVPDFSRATPLTIDFASARWDVAVATFKAKPPDLTSAYAGTTLRQGDPILVMGYPDGGGLIVTEGIFSGAGPDGLAATSAVVGRGDSGGPVFDTHGALVGILIEGAKYNSEGRIVLGYFRPAGAIAPVLHEKPPGIDLATQPEGRKPLPTPEPVQIAYAISDTNDAHEGVSRTERKYQHRFSALSGYQITSASFRALSANHVSSQPEVAINSGGETVTISYALESGPVFDRWRGWLAGTLMTSQQWRK